MRLFLTGTPLMQALIVLILSLMTSIGSAKPSAEVQLKPDKKWLRTALSMQGFSRGFIELAIKTYDEKSYQTVLKLNTLGFLRKSNHMNLVTNDGIRRSQAFLGTNQLALQRAEERYSVSPEVVTSLLWIETRHGALKGNFHIVSVFLHLFQAERKAVRAELVKMAKKDPGFDGTLSGAELKKKIRERTAMRAKWAVAELRALETIHDRKMFEVAKLKGSFAGAFGLPQFVPSSYLKYSASYDGKRPANLFDMRDVILSVGRYLRLHGWKAHDEGTQLKALFEYNNSRDYAESILEMSRILRGKTGPNDRVTASENQ